MERDRMRENGKREWIREREWDVRERGRYLMRARAGSGISVGYV